MLQVLQLLAVFCATLFAGAALYISVVEHPARMTLDTRTAATQWAPSYARADAISNFNREVDPPGELTNWTRRRARASRAVLPP